MTGQLDLTVVVVSYNTCDLLAECLESLKPNAVATEVIVIDNASRDGSAELVRKRFPHVRLVENKSNVGYAAANNQGIRTARGRHVLFLNPDTRVEKGALDHMISYLEREEDVGAVGLRLLNADGSLQPSGQNFPTLASALGELLPIPAAWRRRFRGPIVRRDYTQVCEVDEVSGAAMGVRRKALDEVGPFDQEFVFLGEDIDLCWRLRKAGWKVMYLPTASVIHYGGQSQDKVSPYAISLLSQRSYYLLFCKHRSLVERFALKDVLVFLVFFKLAKWLGLSLLQLKRDWLYPVARLHIAELVWLARN